jgi:shikimate dehydrogenase
MTDSRKISAKTKVCAVIGNPVEHSLSPAIHNAAFEALGLDYAYVAFGVEDIAAAIGGVRALNNFRGLSVTIPHKVSIMEHLDEIDEVARNIGSVNTVVKDGDVLRGSSSDGPGALKALRDCGADPAGKPILILGSGGAARAIAFTLATMENPPSISMLGVIPDELDALAHDLRDKTPATITSGPLDDESLKKGVSETGIIIHCTPIGMHPKTDATLVPAGLLRPDHVVFDIVYNPRETRLLREARAAGCRIVQGLEMFVNQAVVQFELWTGETAPTDVMRKIVEDSLK